MAASVRDRRRRGPAGNHGFPRAKVQGRGFEPLKAEPAGLQPAPFGHSGTPAKSGHCSVVFALCRHGDAHLDEAARADPDKGAVALLAGPHEELHDLAGREREVG
jgi:hypothetical protein